MFSASRRVKACRVLTHSGSLETIPAAMEVTPSLMVTTERPVFRRPTASSSTISPTKKGVACRHKKPWQCHARAAAPPPPPPPRRACYTFALADELRVCRTFMFSGPWRLRRHTRPEIWQIGKHKCLLEQRGRKWPQRTATRATGALYLETESCLNENRRETSSFSDSSGNLLEFVFGRNGNPTLKSTLREFQTKSGNFGFHIYFMTKNDFKYLSI